MVDAPVVHGQILPGMSLLHQVACQGARHLQGCELFSRWVWYGSFVRESRIRLQITGLGRGMQLDAVIIGAMMAGLEDWRLGLGDSAESILEDKPSEMCLAG